MDEIAALLEPLIPALRRYAFALIGDHEGADDLVQETLERALSRWHLRRRDGNLRAWLFTIERNLFVTGLRKKRRGVQIADIEDINSIAASMPPANLPHTRDILSALASLPEEQSSVLLLAGVEDFSYEEVAQILDIPIGTVMSRLSRGRARLRELLDMERQPILRRVK